MAISFFIDFNEFMKSQKSEAKIPVLDRGQFPRDNVILEKRVIPHPIAETKVFTITKISKVAVIKKKDEIIMYPKRKLPILKP